MYSQNKEESYIIDYFKGFTGSLLDIGANDGITFSNSRRLIELGWEADLVEPSPKAFKRLEKLYDKNKNVFLWNTAISDQSGEAILLESGSLINKNDTSLVSSLKKDETVKWKKVNFNEVKVATTTINELWTNAFEPNWDFISIDAEGMDFEILAQIDLANVKMICVEHNGKEEKKYLDYCKGMKLVYKSGENLLLAR